MLRSETEVVTNGTGATKGNRNYYKVDQVLISGRIVAKWTLIVIPIQNKAYGYLWVNGRRMFQDPYSFFL